MLFTSLAFFIFLGISLLVYYLVPKKWQWIILLILSMIFYVSFSWKFLFFIIFTIFTIWGGARLIDNYNEKQTQALSVEGLTLEDKKTIKQAYKKKKKIILVCTILLNIGILVFLKYANFFISSFTGILSLFGVQCSPIVLYLILPLGISFYIFQSVGYLIDVYWGKVKAQKNVCKIALFVSFFPQVIQGPISRYSELAPQFEEEHKFNYNNVMSGFMLILWGLFKKLVIADVLGSMVNIGFSQVFELNSIQSIFAILCYLVQDYADFSGCIDIARGVAQCFGVKLPENFRRPYFSLSVPEYWRRWHITLGTWFKDYIFYPMSMSKTSLKLGKVGKKLLGNNFGKQLPAIFGLIVTWGATGLWHGASWNYVIWGLYYGVILILGIVFKSTYTKLETKLHIKTNSWHFKTFQWVRTIWLLCVGRIIFRCATLGEAWYMFTNTFGFFAFNWDIASLSMFLFNESAIIASTIFAVVLIIFDIYKERHPEVSVRDKIFEKGGYTLQAIVIVVLIMVILLFGSYGPGFNAQDFIYMQF